MQSPIHPAGPKKIPGPTAFDPGMSLFYPKILCAPSLPKGMPRPFQAGFLTHGLTYWLRLPILRSFEQWHCAAFVPDYSRGPVTDLHGVPF